MARLHGKDLTVVDVDDSAGTVRDLKAETLSIDFGPGAEVHDTTTIGDSWREFTAGLKDGAEITHRVFYEDTATTGTWVVYNGRIGVAGTFKLGTATRTASMETIVTKLGMPVNVGEMVMLEATHRVTGAVTFV